MSESNRKRKASSSEVEPAVKKPQSKVANISTESNSQEQHHPSIDVFTNVDLVVLILEFLATADGEANDELDNCALVSRTFSAARNQEQRFDQTRTGTIIFRTPFHQVPIRQWRYWNRHVFTGNRTRLVAILTDIPWVVPRDVRELPFELGSVRHVVLARDSPLRSRTRGGHGACFFFRALVPNLYTFDVGSLARTIHRFFSPPLAVTFFHPTAFRCVIAGESNSRFVVGQPDDLHDVHLPYDYTRRLRHANALREFHVDPLHVWLRDYKIPGVRIDLYCMERDEYEEQEWFSALQRRHGGGGHRLNDYVLLQEYPNLERVTLGRTTYSGCYGAAVRPLPQAALIKFVRHSPSLRWFKSDLTPENIAMLKAERPEVEFVRT